MSAAERAAFLDELLRAHTLEIAAAKRRAMADPAAAQSPLPGTVPVRMEEDGTVRCVPRTREAGADAPPTASASDELTSGLRRGQRLEIDGNDGPRAFKVAWISSARKLFILTRHPDKSLTLQGPELAFILQGGRARVVSDDSALECAIESATAGAGGRIAVRPSDGPGQPEAREDVPEKRAHPA